jgi:hypothetical protein
MCFEAAALDDLGWRSYGLAEDAEQHLRLLRAGYRVDFVPRARVSGFMATTLAGSGEQHRRWEAGRLHLYRKACALFALGVRRGNIAMTDAAIDHLLPPLSVLVAALLVMLAAALAAGATAAAAVSATGAAGVVLYVAVGAILLRPEPMALARALAAAPAYVAWKIWTYVRSLAVRESAPWVRTSRDEAR